MKELAALTRKSWRVVSAAPQPPSLQIVQTRFMITRIAFISRRANLRRIWKISGWYRMRIVKLIIISKTNKASARPLTALRWQRRDFLCPVVKIPQMRSKNRPLLQARQCSSNLTRLQGSTTQRTHLFIKWVRMFQKMQLSIKMRLKDPPGSKTKIRW